MNALTGAPLRAAVRGTSSGPVSCKRAVQPIRSRPMHNAMAMWRSPKVLDCGGRSMVRRLEAGSDFDSQEAGEGPGIEITEDAWRQRVRAKVAKEIAEEKKIREEGGEEPKDRVDQMGAELVNPEQKIFTAVTGSAAVLAVAATVTLLTNALGVDVFSRLHMPEDPISFAQTCMAWTLPGVLGTAFAWNRIFFSEEESELYDIFRDEAWDARDVISGETSASMALSGAILAVAEGIVFRGTGLALSADVFAGIPPSFLPDQQHQATVDLLQLRLFPEYHLPVMWVWPSIVLGAAALEAAVEAMSQGGIDLLDRKSMTEMLRKCFMTETTEVQYASAEGPGGVELQKAGKRLSIYQVSGAGLTRVVETFHDQLGQQSKRQAHMYAGPGLILAKAVFLSMEAVLTDSLLAALITGAACEAVQSVISLDYLEKRIQEESQ